MAYRRKKQPVESSEIGMTAMIDVVFQLLVYFIVTMKPVDVAAHLDVFRPSATTPPEEVKQPPRMIRIQIFKGALVMNDRSVDIARLGDVLRKLGAISETQTVMIMCARDSEHDKLIQVLDRCSKARLTNLSVVSMN